MGGALVMLQAKAFSAISSLVNAIGEVSGTFTDEQVTAINTSLKTGIDNILGIFVKLLPVMAVIAGIGYGIRFVMRRFRDVKNAK